MVKIIQGATKKPVSSKRLAHFFANRPNYNGFLYIGYPIIGTSEGSFPIDAIWVSPDKGLVVFCIVEGKDPGNFENEQDDTYNKLESKLRSHRSLVQGRALRVDIKPITFAPTLPNAPELSSSDYPVCNEENLDQCLKDLDWQNAQYYKHLVAVIQSISSIRKGTKKGNLFGRIHEVRN